jgi:hypothetical protein
MPFNAYSSHFSLECPFQAPYPDIAISFIFPYLIYDLVKEMFVCFDFEFVEIFTPKFPDEKMFFIDKNCEEMNSKM